MPREPIDRRSVLRGLGVGTAALVGGAGVATAKGNGKGRDGASGDKGIVETADDEGFSTLITAVKAAEPVVLETLTNDDQYTVFAPTNGAFEDFLSETGYTLEYLLTDPNGLLTDTLLFHVTEGRRYAASIVNAPEVETLLGEPVSVGNGDDGDVELDGRAGIGTPNVEASNGVIHGIDAVLTTPAVDDILDE